MFVGRGGGLVWLDVSEAQEMNSDPGRAQTIYIRLHTLIGRWNLGIWDGNIWMECLGVTKQKRRGEKGRRNP